MASPAGFLIRGIMVRPEETGIIFGHQALVHEFIVKETGL
jgi:hypothetical protein